MAAKTITPETYLPRVVDAQIQRYLSVFGAIEITGTKWCGKTWSARAHGASIIYVDRGNNPEIISADPAFALKGAVPHVVDEWQQVPAIWDTVRHEIDDRPNEKGLWILTGSSTPHKNEVAHSGAGRIGRVRMLPMSLAESGDSAASVSLRGLFAGEFATSKVKLDIEELAEVICRGGWPEVIMMTSEDSQLVVREYLHAIYDQSIPQLGKSSDTAERLVTSLARNLGQTATLSTLNKDVLGEGTSSTGSIASEKTVSAYLETLSSLFLTESIRGWAPPARSPKRVQVKEKRYFADPSLVVAALGMSKESLLDDWQTFGLIYENLCMRDLLVYSRSLPMASNNPVRYYRDDSGLEVDAIVETSDGSWGAFEIKLSETKAQDAVDTLLRFKEKLFKNPQTKMKQPSFLAVLVGAGEYTRRTPEGVYVIPVRALGP